MIVSNNIKGKCIICKSTVDVSTLNESSVLVPVVIPVVCKNCNNPDGEDSDNSERSGYEKNPKKRRYSDSSQ